MNALGLWSASIEIFQIFIIEDHNDHHLVAQQVIVQYFIARSQCTSSGFIGVDFVLADSSRL